MKHYYRWLITYLISSVFFITSSTLSAAEVVATDPPTTNTEQIKTNLNEDDSYWELDLGISLEFGKNYIQGIDEHEKGDLTGSLILSGGYYYKDFFLEVSPLIGRPFTIGYSLQRTKHFVVNLIAESLFQGFDQSSQNHGQQLTGIKSRNTSLDAGVEVYYSHQYGETRFRALHDVSNTHNGYVIAFDYAYPLFMKRWVVWPSYGIAWLSENTTDYYFGVSKSEALSYRPFYKPSSAFTHKVNLYVAYQYNTNISFIGYGDYIVFSNEINRSPLISPNNDSFRLGMGVVWSF